MLKRLLGLALFVSVALVSQPVFATQARIDSMGGGARYWTMEDEVNIFDFPSLLANYGDMVYVDNIGVVMDGAGNPIVMGNTRFGLHLEVGTEELPVVLGVYGGRINSYTRGVGGGFDVAGNAFTGMSGLGVGAQASRAVNANGGPAGVGMIPLMQGGQGDSLVNVDMKIGLFTALRIADQFRFGIMLNFLADDGDLEQPDLDAAGAQTDRGAFLVDLALGLGVDISVEARLEVALGFEIGTLHDYRDAYSFSTPPGTPNQNLVEHWTASHFGMRIHFRFVYEFDDKYHIVPYLRFHYGQQDVEQINMSPPLDQGHWSGFDLAIGADLRMQLFDDVWVVPGIGIRFAQQTLDGAVTQIDRDMDQLMSLPFYGVGVDLRIVEWLDFRFGANQYINFNRHSETTIAQPGIPAATDERQTQDVITNLATGLGFNIPVNESKESWLRLDINVNPLFWISGPDFVTGAANNVNPWGVSGAIQYDW